jgi:pilus assembly protein CpaB
MKIGKANLKATLPYLGIIFLAAAVVWAANSYLKSRTAEVEEQLVDKASRTRVTVVVPIRPLKAGELVDTAILAMREVPKEYVNSDAVTKETVADYQGKKLIRDVSQGTPLLASFIAQYEFTPFSQSISPGDRALTIPVDEINSVSGMLTAGDNVDLLVLMQKEASDSIAGRSEMELVPLLEGVTVRATGTFTQNELVARRESPQQRQNSNRPAGSYTTITISIPPRDAQKLILAQQAGRIVALMRSPGDASFYGKRLSSREVFGYGGVPTETAGNTISYIIGGNFSSGSQGTHISSPSGAGNASAGVDNEIISRLMRAAQKEQ